MTLTASRINASGGPAAEPRRAEDWLALAAAPTFAVMAVLNATAAVDPAAVICSAAGLSPMHGMLAMYLLMAAFHLHPWVKVVRTCRPGGAN